MEMAPKAENIVMLLGASLTKLGFSIKLTNAALAALQAYFFEF